MHVEIQSAQPEEAPLLKQLLEVYLDELSAFEIGSADRQDAPSYQYLHLYWSDPNRFPFLARLDGNVAGFALVRREPPESVIEWQLAEFCILSEYRKRGVGREAMDRLFRELPGHWELEVLVANTAALAFWHKCLARPGVKDRHTEPILKEDGPRLLHRFTAVAAESPLPD